MAQEATTTTRVQKEGEGEGGIIIGEQSPFQRLLIEWELEDYIISFKKDGWTDPEDWHVFIDNDNKEAQEALRQLIPKLPHVLKFKRLLAKWIESSKNIKEVQTSGEQKNEEKIGESQHSVPLIRSASVREFKDDYPFAGGPYWFMSVATGRFLDVEGGAIDEGTRLIQWDFHGKANQQFFLKKSQQSGCYNIQCAHSHLYWEMQQNTLKQRKFNEKPSQCFYVQRSLNGTFEFICKEDLVPVDDQLFQERGNATTRHFRILYALNPKEPYVLKAKHSNLCLDVQSASSKDGTPLIQWNFHGKENQQFYFEQAEAGHYFVRCAHSNKYWDVNYAATTNGTPIIQYKLHGDKNQQFLVELRGSKYCRIIARHSGLALDVKHASLESWGKIHQWNCHEGANQDFKLLTVNEARIDSMPPIDPGLYYIRAYHSGKFLDIEGGSTKDGARLIQWDFHGKKNQLFQLEPAQNNKYYIKAMHSGKYLDVQYASVEQDAIFIQNQLDKNRDQSFYIMELSDAAFELMFCASSLMLDVKSASEKAGEVLHQWSRNGQKNQKFELCPAHLINNKYIIEVFLSNMVLDVAAASTLQGAKIIQWPAHRDKNQQFTIEMIANGYYIIKAVHTGFALTAERKSEGKVTQFASNGSVSQQFIISALGSGLYRIKNQSHQLCFEIPSIKKEEDLRQGYWCNGDHQKFRFIPLF